MSDYVMGTGSLPDSLDVQISVSNAQTAIAQKLNTLCVVCNDLGMFPDASRVRFYPYPASNAVGADFGTTSEPYLAAQNFDAQGPANAQFAVGEAFDEAQPGLLIGLALTAANITTLRAITDGSMAITLGATTYNLVAMNFSAASTRTLIAAAIQSALTAASAPFTCSAVTPPGGSELIVIASVATGDGAMVPFPTAVLGTTITTEYLGTSGLDDLTAAAWTGSGSVPAGRSMLVKISTGTTPPA